MSSYKARPKTGQFIITLPFRPLQNFCDKWRDNIDTENISGIEEFLRLSIQTPLEDPIYVSSAGEHESDRDLVGFTGEPGLCAAVPRSISAVPGTYFTTNLAGRLTFYRKRENKVPDQQDESVNDPATPQHLLALDLVEIYSETFEIESGLEFIGCPLSFVWTEIPGQRIIVPWPVKVANNPTAWIEEHKTWIEIFRTYKNLMEYKKSEISDFDADLTEELFKAWCAYRIGNTPDNNDLLKKELSCHVASLCDPDDMKFAGLWELIRDPSIDFDNYSSQFSKYICKLNNAKTMDLAKLSFEVKSIIEEKSNK